MNICRALFLLLFVASCFAADIDGTWELVNISSIPHYDTHPAGNLNHKMHYDGNGNAYLYGPNEVRSDATVKVAYSVANGERRIDDGKGTVINTPFTVEDGLMTLTFGENNIWTYIKVSGPDVILPMKSVAVIRQDDPKLMINSLDVHYDNADYTKLSQTDRVTGVWEVISYANVDGPNRPPYGFRNEKFVFYADGSFIRVEPWVESPDGAKRQMWAIDDSGLSIEVHAGRHIAPQAPESGKYTYRVGFNAHCHMLLIHKDASLRLALLSRSTESIPIIPTKIALLNRESIELPEASNKTVQGTP